jgi:hypothetical protein
MAVHLFEIGRVHVFIRMVTMSYLVTSHIALSHQLKIRGSIYVCNGWKCLIFTNYNNGCDSVNAST